MTELAVKSTAECTGSCHCGAVAYTVPSELGDVKYCYCESCRKLNGSAFSAVALVTQGQFKFLRGEHELVQYESSPGKHRYFCGKCYSPIIVKLDSKPGEARIRLGSLDFEPKVRVTGHIWVKEKPAWFQITDELPQLDEF